MFGQNMNHRAHQAPFKIFGSAQATVTGTAASYDYTGKQVIIYNSSAAVVYISGVNADGSAEATTSSFPIPVGASLVSVTGKFSLVAASGSNVVSFLIVGSEADENDE